MSPVTYSLEIDSVTQNEWCDLLLVFRDANLHQAWTEKDARLLGKRLSHIIVKSGSDVAAVAQVSIRKVPFLRSGIANVYWGPLWKKRGSGGNYAALEKMFIGLKEEYAYKRRFLLRVWPAEFGQDVEEEYISIFKKHGFIQVEKSQPYRTLLIDLSMSLDELRENLASKWRNKLNQAERNNLEIVEGDSDEMYVTFLKLMKELTSRKKFRSNVDRDRVRKIQKALPKPLKMRIFLCFHGTEPVASAVITAIGETGTYLLGATGNRGLKVKGSYLIHWRVIQWLKEKGCRWYDLGGIDPIGNPGVYHFKRGLAGKSGRDVTHMGEFYISPGAITDFILMGIDRLR